MKHSLLSDPWYTLGVVLFTAGMFLVGCGIGVWISA